MIAPLREIMKEEYTNEIGDNWAPAAQDAWSHLKSAILDDPCLMRCDHQKITVLRTDFSAIGFGYVACQPANDAASIAAMDKYLAGGSFDFMTPESAALLRPVAFGSRRSKGNETKLHSHLGEGFAGDWAINKCRHMCFGQRFIWVTDNYAIKFILSYAGGNPAILRLQMRLMGWDMTIVHRANKHLTNADYWSRLGEDLCFDPLLQRYLELTNRLRTDYPPERNLPMHPRNMPYYRGPRASPEDTSPQPAPSHYNDAFPCSMATIPPCFGSFPSATTNATSTTPAQDRYNSEINQSAHALSSFRWAVYSFNSGHFYSSIQSRSLPFNIHYACDPFVAGRSLFTEIGKCSSVHSTGAEFLHHVRSSGDRTPLHGYLIHSHRFQHSGPTTKFWQLQAAIVTQLCLVNQLSMVIAFVHPDHDGRSVSTFIKQLGSDGWLLSRTSLSFPDYGDTIVDTCGIIIGVHSSTTANASALSLHMPPSLLPKPISHFTWEPFNTPQYAISVGPLEPAFTSPDTAQFKITQPTQSDGAHTSSHLHLAYYLQPLLASGPQSSVGSTVLKHTSLCPAFSPTKTNNPFQHYFGIEFIAGGVTHIRPFSPFEFAACFSLGNDLTYALSRKDTSFGLDAGIPGITSAWIFDQVLERLIDIRDANTEVFEPNQFSPATSLVAINNTSVSVRMPLLQQWVECTDSDPELSLVKRIILNPSLLTKQNLAQINYNSRGPLRKSLLVIEEGIIILKEPIAGGNSYTRLQVVPPKLHNILFVAFHSNPIGGHFDAARTLHRLRLLYYWPHMYKYIVRMCAACPGCSLSNLTKSKSADLVYNFPIDAPFRVMHVDGYSAGKHVGFEGSETYLIGCCGMCSFACMEPISVANATSFASGIMKIQLRYGICHTIVLDKDSKFMGVCREALNLLNINCHILSGGNHNPMLVERINRYLNKGLRIMTNERNSVRVAMESILLLLYAWNSCPIPGTDISRSLVAVGRKFAFPIDYSTGDHFSLTSHTPSKVENYAADLAARLSACREVATILVDKHRAWHRELVNSQRPDPHIYSIGDIVFARRAVKSQRALERVDKLMYGYTGPWKVLESLPGASYKLKHCTTNRTDKKHASDLSPYPLELIPLLPLEGSDNTFGQLYKPIQSNPFAEAGITGYEPITPYQTQANLATVVPMNDFHWPSLSELNDEHANYPWASDSERDQVAFERDAESITTPIFYTGPPPSPPTIDTPTCPPLPELITSVISSLDRLFFVSIAPSSSSSSTSREWRLIRVALSLSTSQYPLCLQDGRFLVEHFTCHPNDTRFNAINQRCITHRSATSCHTQSHMTHIYYAPPTHQRIMPYAKT